jgi:hypothetical protein
VEARTEVVCNILMNLAHHRRIQTLDLGFSDIVGDVATALAHLLGTTTSLRSLKGGYTPEDLTAEDMEVIINGLRSNHGTLTELDLREFPRDAVEAYVDYFKSMASPQNKLRVLKYFNSNLEALSESMVIPNSIGSKLRVLRTWGNYDFMAFANSLASQGSQNKLESLHIHSLSEEEKGVALCRCLPSLVNLAELHIEHYRCGNEISHGFVKALKRNGSLHKVTVSPTLNNRYDRHVEAFGQRNQQVPVCWPIRAPWTKRMWWRWRNRPVTT